LTSISNNNRIATHSHRDIFFKYHTATTTATGEVTATTTTTTNNQHIDFSFSVHSERIIAYILEEVHPVIYTRDVYILNSRTAIRVNTATDS
jgi:hypothetical protein